MASAECASSALHILVVDRDPVFRRFVRELAATHATPALTVEEAETWDAAAARAGGEAPDAIVLAVDSADAVATQIAEALARAPVVATSGSGSLSLAVAAMRAGAADFLARPVRGDVLMAAIGRAAAPRRQEPRPQPRGEPDFERFVGRSEAMRGVFELISRVAPSRAPVFITGESGTGKELTAEAIHTRSGRPGEFVAINCSAIPRDLMESEVFGHVRGAFTGAQDDRAGAAELAHGGTLFLDEVCEMEPDLQTKLLRFIQSGTLRRVGDTRLRSIDVRFVCATNRDPDAEVAAGRFRSDLYYRLHVLPIHLPPLRDRRDDVMPLAEAFLADFAAEEGRRFTGFEASARALLVNFDWPGNVRQLQNVLRRAVVMNDGPELSADMLALALAHAGHQPADPAIAPSSVAPRAIEPYWMQERRIIERALDACEGNVVRAAAALGISASTIYRKKIGWDPDGQSRQSA